MIRRNIELIIMQNNLTEFNFRTKYNYQEPQISFRVKLKKALHWNYASFYDVLVSFFPFFVWLPNYSIKHQLPGDIIGGITTAIIRIPQSLAYGLLAGLAPINGVYTAFFSPLVYACMGSSSHVSVGTFAVISLMLRSALEKVLVSNPNEVALNVQNSTAMPVGDSAVDEFYKLSIIGTLTLMIGGIQIGLGLFRLGFISILMSDPLVAGFTTGAAVYVVAAQVKYLFGIKLHRHPAPFSLFKLLIELFTRINETIPAEVVISLLTIVALYPVKLINIKYKKQLRNIPIPMELIIVVVATLISSFVDLEGLFGVEVVGFIPSGMPVPYFPSTEHSASLLSDAFSIAIVSFAITVSIGKLFAKKHSYKIDPNQELVALGVAQLVCAFFRGHACSGALARSSVKESSGSKTQFSDVVSSLVILLVLLVVGPYLSNLPVACLAAIIVVNIRTLFRQFLGLRQLWNLSRYDFVTWIITFVATILFGVDMGLIVGVFWLLLSIVLQRYLSDTAMLGRVNDTDVYRSLASFDVAAEPCGVKIIKLPDAPYFGNIEILQEITKEVLTSVKKPEGDHRDHLEMSPLVTERPATPTPATPTPLHDSKISFHSSANNVSATTSRDGNLGRDWSNVEVDSQLRALIFDCSSWLYIDTMGVEALKQICKEFNDKEIKIFFAGLESDVFNKLERAGVISDSESNVHPYPTLRHAVRAACAPNPTPSTESTLFVED